MVLTCSQEASGTSLGRPLPPHHDEVGSEHGFGVLVEGCPAGIFDETPVGRGVPMKRDFLFSIHHSLLPNFPNSKTARRRS